MSNPPNRWETAATAAIALLSATSALLGLVRDGHYADPAAGLARIYAQDAVILGIGVPVLVLALVWARHGSIRGRLVWLGALAYMVYMWTHYAFVVAYNDFFLGYVALFGLSVFTLLSGAVTTDALRIYQVARSEISTGVYGGFLGVAAAGVGFMWLFDIVPALLAGETPSAIAQLGPEAAHTYVIDLGILVPALAIAAVWLRRERPWGYTAAGASLVFAALIAPTLTAVTAVDLIEGIEISTPLLLGTIVPPLVGLLFAGRYLWNLPDETC